MGQKPRLEQSATARATPLQEALVSILCANSWTSTILSRSVPVLPALGVCAWPNMLGNSGGLAHVLRRRQIPRVSCWRGKTQSVMNANQNRGLLTMGDPWCESACGRVGLCHLFLNSTAPARFYPHQSFYKVIPQSLGGRHVASTVARLG